MLNNLIAGAMLAVSASAASAAVYQYDITMAGSGATLFDVIALTDAVTTSVPDGVSCSETGSPFESDQIACRGDVNVSVTDAGLPAEISAILEVETGSDTNTVSSCMGNFLICSADIVESASATGFVLQGVRSDGGVTVTESGLTYQNDLVYSYEFGGLNYQTNTFEGADIFYSTTRLEITEVSAVPLPASLPLISFGLGALTLAGRRRKN